MIVALACFIAGFVCGVIAVVCIAGATFLCMWQRTEGEGNSE